MHHYEWFFYWVEKWILKERSQRDKLILSLSAYKKTDSKKLKNEKVGTKNSKVSRFLLERVK